LDYEFSKIGQRIDGSVGCTSVVTGQGEIKACSMTIDRKGDDSVNIVTCSGITEVEVKTGIRTCLVSVEIQVDL